MWRYTVAVDLNGVLDTYSGWRGEAHTDPPRPGAREFLQELAREYKVVVFTTQPAERVWRWLREHEMAAYVAEVTDRKPPAVAYIDDRALTFRGDFAETLREVRNFQPYWQQEPKRCAWCSRWIKERYATIKTEKGEKYICGPECMMWYAAVLLGWDEMEKIAKEIMEKVEDHKKAEAEKAKLPNDLPF